MLRRDWHRDVLSQFPTTRKGTHVRPTCRRSSLERSLSNEQGLIMNRPARHFSTTPETTPMVLIGEDQPAIRGVVADRLQDEGYAVRQASGGLQAIDKMEVDDVYLVHATC